MSEKNFVDLLNDEMEELVENLPQVKQLKVEIERLTEEKSFATRKMMEGKAKAVELQQQVEKLTEERDKYQEKWQTSYMNELNLQKQVDEFRKDSKIYEEIYDFMKEKGIVSVDEMKTLINFSLKSSMLKEHIVKDTAKEIIDELNSIKPNVRATYSVQEQVGMDIAINRVKTYFKQKGVEVE